jgi:hypothetical protein
MNTTDLKAEYEILKTQLSDVNTQITNIIKTKNKRYTYSNVESSHSAETQSLKELQDLKASIKLEMISIENQLSGCFVKLKNY